jgi:hypothetical protein
MFERGTLFRHALDVLRTAEEPLTTRERVLAMLQARGLSEPTAKQVRDLYGGAQSSLRNCNGKSVVRVGERAPKRWSMCYISRPIGSPAMNGWQRLGRPFSGLFVQILLSVDGEQNVVQDVRIGFDGTGTAYAADVAPHNVGRYTKQGWARENGRR